MIDTIVIDVFASKVIVVLTIFTISALVKATLIKIVEQVAGLFSVKRGFKQYVRLAVSEPTFWIDNLIGFGPNGVRQHTRARKRHVLGLLGAIIGYLIITLGAAYLAALYLGEQQLVAFISSSKISPYPYTVTQWGPSANETGGLILGPILARPNISWHKVTAVAVLSNSMLVHLGISLNTSALDASGNLDYNILEYYFVVDDIIIPQGHDEVCDLIFDNIFVPGITAVTNSKLDEYFQLGVIAPILTTWTGQSDLNTRSQIETCLKNNIIFGYAISNAYLRVPLGLLACFLALAVVMVILFRIPPNNGAFSYYIGSLGAYINTEPLNFGLTVKLWRSEIAGLDDSALPLAERDTSARLQLGSTSEKGDENVLQYGMFRDQEYYNKEDLKALIVNDAAYIQNNTTGRKRIVIGGLKSPNRNSYHHITP
ncbi:hypothetical protein BGZ49_001507 [Haplosporangium sp. Z 27]|nr:hypothetical protein BGZ49_001507 [Haplosporangium sp. Z 27]